VAAQRGLLRIYLGIRSANSTQDRSDFIDAHAAYACGSDPGRSEMRLGA